MQGSRRAVYEVCWFRSRHLINDETGHLERKTWFRALSPKPRVYA